MGKIAVRNAKWGVALACAFEVFSIATGKTPTISDLCGRHPWLAPAVVVALAAHLAAQPRPQVAGDCPFCPESF